MATATSKQAVQLVPDTILHLIEKNGFISDPKALINLRLLSKTWNYTLRHFVGSENLVTKLTEENLSSFSKFLSSEESLKLQESNIRSVDLKIKSHCEDDLKKTLNDFLQLPKFFRSNLNSFKLNCEVDFLLDFKTIWNFLRLAQFGSLEELEIVVEKNLFHIPVPENDSCEGLSFEYLQKLVVPLHLSLPFLKICTDLKHLSLHVFDVELPSNFWGEFKHTVCINGLNQTIDELFLADKREIVWEFEADVVFSFAWLFECNFSLKKLGLGVNFDLEPEEGTKEELLKFLIQQSGTVSYLQLPSLASSISLSYSHGGYSDTFISDVAYFPNLKELKFDRFNERSGRLFARSPSLEKVLLPSVYSSSDAEMFFNGCMSGRINSVVVQDMDHAFAMSLNWNFPNIRSLEVRGTIPNSLVMEPIFRLAKTKLKKLSLKVEFDISEERSFSWMTGNGPLPKSSEESDVDNEGNKKRRVITDCFLPKRIRRLHTSDVGYTEETKFQTTIQNRFLEFQNLEYLSLEGSFTELTISLGIKILNRLKEFHLITQHSIPLSTMVDLESHLEHLHSWSYTRLAKAENGYRKMFKCFRSPLKAVGADQFHVWKFNDDNVEKKVVTLREFESLDLSYTGTRDTLVPEYFFPEIDSDSEWDRDFDGYLPDSDDWSSSSESDDDENEDED